MSIYSYIHILIHTIQGAPLYDAVFCVTSEGCTFQDVDDDNYHNMIDDDFPSNDDYRKHNQRPTAHPVSPPSSSSSSDNGDAAYIYKLNLTLAVRVKASSSSSSSTTMDIYDSDVAFVGYAVKHFLIRQGIEVWNAQTILIGTEDVYVKKPLLQDTDISRNKKRVKITNTCSNIYTYIYSYSYIYSYIYLYIYS